MTSLLQGPTGSEGPRGFSGAQGSAGDPGVEGRRGPKGPRVSKLHFQPCIHQHIIFHTYIIHVLKY